MDKKNELAGTPQNVDDLVMALLKTPPRQTAAWVNIICDYINNRTASALIAAGDDASAIAAVEMAVANLKARRAK